MDLLSGFLSQLVVDSYLPEIDNLENFKQLPIKINQYLANDEWLKLNRAMIFITQSQFSDNEDLMKEFSSKIIVPEKHWKSLERGKTRITESIIITSVIDTVSYYGSKETVVKLFTEHNGVKVLVQFFKNQHCTDNGQKFCLSSLLKLLEKTDDDFEFAKLMVPVATRFKDLLETKKVIFEVFLMGVQLIHVICSFEGPKSLMSKVFKLEVSSYAVKALALCQRFRQEIPIEEIIRIWSSLCRTLQYVLANKAASFNKGHVHTVSKELLRIIKLSAVDLHKDTTERLAATDAATLVLLLLVENERELFKIKDFGIVKVIANAINTVLKHGESNELAHGMVCNGFIIIDSMISIESSVRPIAPILRAILKSFSNDKTSYSCSSHAGTVASFCNKAVKEGNKEDVKHLVKSGLMPLLVKLRDYLTCAGSLIELIEVLYHLILKVPETDEFFYFKGVIYDPLHHIDDSISFKCGKEHLKMKTITFIYVIAAVGISCMCIDEATLKSLDKYFCRLFQEMKSCEIPKKYPGAFLVKNMAKVKSFKSSVLPHIWYITEHGPDELVKDIFDSLPDLEEPFEVKFRDEKKHQIFKQVLVEVKTVFDRKSDYQTSSLIKLTKFLTTIPCSEQDDIVLYHLEDLVSPCLGLLEEQDNKEIIRHVKKFINNLHYS